MFRHSLQQLVRCTKPQVGANQGRYMSSAAKPLVDLTVDDKSGIATLTLDRPPVNSLSLELLSAISQSLDQVQQNRSKGLILTSSSPKVFSAGLDIMEMYKPDIDRATAFWTTLQDVWLKLYGSAFPTAAAINGHSPAGGCLLSISCEYRVMLPNLTIGLNETQLGIMAPDFFVASYRNVLSNRDAELALTLGKLFSTDEALRVGLIDEVASDKEDALAKCAAFLKQFRKVSPIARSITKQQYRAPALTALCNNREADLQQFLTVIQDPKVQVGLGLYLESLKKK